MDRARHASALLLCRIIRGVLFASTLLIMLLLYSEVDIDHFLIVLLHLGLLLRQATLSVQDSTDGSICAVHPCATNSRFGLLRIELGASRLCNYIGVGTLVATSIISIRGRQAKILVLFRED